MDNAIRRRAFLLVLSLLILSAVCGIWLYFTGNHSGSDAVTAYIYQDGDLIQSIRLDQVTDSFTLTITGTDGCVNEVTVCPDAIGIVFADCPDQICVARGMVSDSLLPIVCLPNRLVIVIRQGTDVTDPSTPDAITY